MLQSVMFVANQLSNKNNFYKLFCVSIIDSKTPIQNVPAVPERQTDTNDNNR